MPGKKRAKYTSATDAALGKIMVAVGVIGRDNGLAVSDLREIALEIHKRVIADIWPRTKRVGPFGPYTIVWDEGKEEK